MKTITITQAHFEAFSVGQGGPSPRAQRRMTKLVRIGQNLFIVKAGPLVINGGIPMDRRKAKRRARRFREAYLRLRKETLR
mgnify:CR=1 FL=1